MAADIDIDFGDRTRVLELIKHHAASLLVQGETRRHNSGVYVTPIPTDPLTNLAAIDYETAEKRGYFKIDFLNVSIYQMIETPEQYDLLLSTEPSWDRLWQEPAWAQQIIHIGNYTELLAKMRPDSIVKMAAFISIIRPGKAHLQNQSWSQVLQQVWDGDTTRGYTFKKAHAISYAALVALHMNLLR